MIELFVLLLFVVMNILDLQTTYLSEKFYEKNPVMYWIKKKWKLKGLIIFKAFTSFMFAISFYMGYVSIEVTILFVLIQLLIVVSNLWAYRNVI